MSELPRDVPWTVLYTGSAWGNAGGNPYDAEKRITIAIALPEGTSGTIPLAARVSMERVVRDLFRTAYEQEPRGSGVAVRRGMRDSREQGWS